MVNAVTPTQPPAQPALAQAKGALVTSDFQTFLKMLTTQMQNQDPLNPIDSTDYAQQLATFSGVEQQVRTNALLESLGAQLGLGSMAEMAGWVGMEVRVTAPVTFDGSPVTLYPAAAPDADQAMLVVLDAAGREVSREPARVTGEPLDWAGTGPTGAPLPAGTYSFRLESYKEGTLAAVTDVATYGLIDEVRSGADGTVLVLESGATVRPDAVQAVRRPG